MISAVFRRGGDVTFVAEELKAVFDPEGGRWMGGRYVPSLLAAIGDVIEGHMIRIGFLVPEADTASDGVRRKSSAAASDPLDSDFIAIDQPTARSSEPPGTAGGQATRSERQPTAGAEQRPGPGPLGRTCPHCGNRSLYRVEGCWTCSDCMYSHCG